MRFLLAASCFFLGFTSWANPRIKQPLIARDDPAAQEHLAAVLSLQTAAVVTTQAVSETTRVDRGASGESSVKPAVLVICDWSIACWEHGCVNVVEFFYHGSQVLAIGLKHPSGDVTWTHAIGRGPLGPCFLKDLTGQGADYFIFTDHLGTPFAWFDPDTGQTTYTPFNPWGELLATPTSGYTPYEHGNVPTSGFNLPTFEVFDVTPLGLAGHIYDEKTGLVYMHHRYLHPRLGHFLTPDFRAPDIYDPSTFTEPYAYAGGNPVLYLDPDGLAKKLKASKKVLEAFISKQLQILVRGQKVDVWQHPSGRYLISGKPMAIPDDIPVVGGRKRIHGDLAGTTIYFPQDSRVAKYNVRGGVKVNKKGEMDFLPHAFRERNAGRLVKVNVGDFDPSREADKRKAWAKAKEMFGLKEQDLPGKYVWHHADEPGDLILVPEDLHSYVKHTGGHKIFMVERFAKSGAQLVAIMIIGNALDAKAGEHGLGEMSVGEGLLLDINPVWQFVESGQDTVEVAEILMQQALDQALKIPTSDGRTVDSWLNWVFENPATNWGALFGAENW